MPNVRALMVDDNAFDRRRLQRVAAESDLTFTFVEACDVREFSKRLDEGEFDVIYVDLDLAGEDGMSLRPLVRHHSVNSNAAMIMVAGNEQAEAALGALRAGFSDYIEKNRLTAAALTRATVNALQKAHLTDAAATAEGESKSMERVLKSFAHACTQEMRPMLARMTRQVRQMRADIENTGVDASGALEIERTCTRIEEFFQDLGAMAVDGKLSSIVAQDQTVTDASSLIARIKPPVQ